MTRPNPAELSVKAGQNIGTLLSYANSIKEFFFLAFFFKYFPISLINSLDALCRRFNIDLSKRTKHNALLDCELLREVYINLLDVKEPKFNLSSLDYNENKFSTKEKLYDKTIIKISEEELKKHKHFLKSEIKKNFY